MSHPAPTELSAPTSPAPERRRVGPPFHDSAFLWLYRASLGCVYATLAGISLAPIIASQFEQNLAAQTRILYGYLAIPLAGFVLALLAGLRYEALLAQNQEEPEPAEQAGE